MLGILAGDRWCLCSLAHGAPAAVGVCGKEPSSPPQGRR